MPQSENQPRPNAQQTARQKVQAFLDAGGTLPPSAADLKTDDGATDWARVLDELEALELVQPALPTVGSEKNDAKKKPDFEERCFLLDGPRLYHQTTSGFIDQEGRIHPEVEIDGKKYRPISGEEIQTNGDSVPPFLLLPDHPEPYGSFRSLIEDTDAFFKKYFDAPDDFRRISALYAALTWFQDKVRTVPYWRVRGDYGKGKTRAWSVVKSVCCNSVSASGALTSAPVFRLIEKWRILTLAIDEADLSKGDETNDIVKIVNMGFEQGGGVMRCDTIDASKIRFFRAYCPKLFSMRHAFQDTATESRCLSNDMRATQREDIPVQLTKEFDREAAVLRNRFLDYRLKKYFAFQPVERPEFPTNLEGRLKQIAIAFYPLFENDQEKAWFNAWLVEYQKKLREERASSWAGQILQEIRDQAEEAKGTNAALEELAFPSSKTVADKLGTHYRAVAKEAKALGFFSVPIWWKDTLTGKPRKAQALKINPDRWAEVCERYAPDGPKAELPPILSPSNDELGPVLNRPKGQKGLETEENPQPQQPQQP